MTDSGLAIDVQDGVKSYICKECEKHQKTARFDSTIAGARHIHRQHGDGSPQAQRTDAESYAPTVVKAVPVPLATRRAVLWTLPPANKAIVAVIIAVIGFIAYATGSAGAFTTALVAIGFGVLMTAASVFMGLHRSVKEMWMIGRDPEHGTTVIRQVWARAVAVKALDPRLFYMYGKTNVPVVDFRAGTARSVEVRRGKPRVPATSLFFYLDQSATKRIAAGSAKLLSPENIQAGVALGALALLLIGIVWAGGHGGVPLSRGH